MKLYPFLLMLLLACQSRVNETDQKKTVSPDTLANKTLPDSLLIGEIIDGPANVRDTVNGKIIFVLKDNIPVTSTDTINRWLRVGLIADITSSQYKDHSFEKGDKILLEGVEVGTVLERMHLPTVMETNQGLKGEVVGYTSIRNIKEETFPEFALAKIVNRDKTPTIDRFIQFFKRGGFNKSDSKNFVGFRLDEIGLTILRL